VCVCVIWARMLFHSRVLTFIHAGLPGAAPQGSQWADAGRGLAASSPLVSSPLCLHPQGFSRPPSTPIDPVGVCFFPPPVTSGRWRSLGRRPSSSLPAGSRLRLTCALLGVRSPVTGPVRQKDDALHLSTSFEWADGAVPISRAAAVSSWLHVMCSRCMEPSSCSPRWGNWTGGCYCSLSYHIFIELLLHF